LTHIESLIQAYLLALTDRSIIQQRSVIFKRSRAPSITNKSKIGVQEGNNSQTK